MGRELKKISRAGIRAWIRESQDGRSLSDAELERRVDESLRAHEPSRGHTWELFDDETRAEDDPGARTYTA